MKAEASGIILHLNEETLHLDIKAGAADWKWADGFCPAWFAGVLDKPKAAGQ